MREELGVYLLECVLIYNPAGTLLKGEERISHRCQTEGDLDFTVSCDLAERETLMKFNIR